MKATGTSRKRENPPPYPDPFLHPRVEGVEGDRRTGWRCFRASLLLRSALSARVSMLGKPNLEPSTHVHRRSQSVARLRHGARMPASVLMLHQSRHGADWVLRGFAAVARVGRERVTPLGKISINKRLKTPIKVEIFKRRPGFRMLATALGRLVLIGTVFLSASAGAESLICGGKVVEIENGIPVRITHEDKTSNDLRGNSYWTFDGRAIEHRLMKKPIACRQGEKLTREEIVDISASQFSDSPHLRGMSPEEGELMSYYVRKKMTVGTECDRLVDGAKSNSRRDTYWIDCKDASGVTRRVWISEKELRDGKLVSVNRPVSRDYALNACEIALKNYALHKDTFEPSRFWGSAVNASQHTGNTKVALSFSAKTAYGTVKHFQGWCTITSSGAVADTTIEHREG